MTHQSSGGIVCCDVDRERFAFHGGDVHLVVRAEQIVAEPAHDGRVGVLHQGGIPVPVYTLAGILGLPAAPARAASHVVVTNGARGSFGVVVDRAVRVGLAERFNVLPLPRFVGPSARRWFGGLLIGADLSCLLLSPEGLEPGGRSRMHMPVEPPRTPPQSRPMRPAEIVVSFTTSALPPCDGDRYALAAHQIGAVVQALPSVPLPGAPDFVTALSWWQGHALPLLDFGKNGSRVPRSRHLLIRTRDGAYAGLPVDADISLRRAGADDRQVRGGSAPFVTGLFTVGSERVALIDVDALVAPDVLAPDASCAG